MSFQSLNTDTLVDFYAPFQPSSHRGWNETSPLGGPSAYFMSQGSEYRLDQPTWSIANGAVTGDVLKGLQGFEARVSAALRALPSNQGEALANSLDSWIAQVSGGMEVEQMTVSAGLDHIRNNQGDDHADLTLLFVYCAPLGVPLLVNAGYDIDWAGGMASVNALISLEGAVEQLDASLPVTEASGPLSTALELLGAETAVSCIEMLSYVGIALAFVDMLGLALVNAANDGGRVNFLAVITHALHRISASTEPFPDEPGSVLSVDPEKLGVGWYDASQASSDGSGFTTSYQEGVYFGTYPWGWRPNSLPPYPNAPYIVGMPEMSWGVCGRSTLVTFKVFSGWVVNTEAVYSILLLVFGPTGELTAVSSAMQTGASAKSMAVPSPAWYAGDSPDGGLIGQVDQTLTDLSLYGATSAQLTYVLPQLMDGIRAASRSSPGDWRSAAQPATYWSVYWSSTAQYDTGSHPAVTVRGDGRVADSHSDGWANVSNLYSKYGSVDAAGNVTWSSTEGDKYDAGDWPTLAVVPGNNGSNVLQIHSGGNNDIWWAYGSFDSSGVVSFSDGQAKLADGDHPAVALQSGGVFVEMHATGANGLAYGVGHFDGSQSVSMYSEDQFYLSLGDYPTLAISGSTIIEVHEYEGRLWFNLGTIGSDHTVSWETTDYSPQTDTYPFTLAGDNPHLAATPQGQVVLTYESGGQIYCAVGELVSGKLVWHYLNGKVCSGETPGLAATPSGGLLMVYASGSSLRYATGAVRTEPTIEWPAGTQINGVDTTVAAPAACVFGGKLYVFWQGSNSYLFYSASTNGQAWPSGVSIQQMTDAYPAACVLGEELFVFWKGHGTGAISYCTTTDGTHWSSPATIPGGTTSSPAACVFQGRLYVFWPTTGSPARIGYSVFDPGSRTWSGGTINNVDYTSAGVAALAFDDQLVLYWRQGDSSGHQLYVGASTDGRSWPSGARTTQSSTTAPAACALGSTAYLFWTADDSRYVLLYGASETGMSWPWSQGINDHSPALSNDPAKGCVGTAVFNDQIYLFWMGTSNKIEYSCAGV
ncbi:MAG TPA: hypothetical protein VHG28_25095 [Longimicrobiaceae bacterium]|nr:hypothetical protein [Longimicrobiaceae bacterium]